MDSGNDALVKNILSLRAERGNILLTTQPLKEIATLRSQ
jgi:hypothetical protein